MYLLFAIYCKAFYWSLLNYLPLLKSKLFCISDKSAVGNSSATCYARWNWTKTFYSWVWRTSIYPSTNMIITFLHNYISLYLSLTAFAFKRLWRKHIIFHFICLCYCKCIPDFSLWYYNPRGGGGGEGIRVQTIDRRTILSVSVAGTECWFS